VTTKLSLKLFILTNFKGEVDLLNKFLTSYYIF